MKQGRCVLPAGAAGRVADRLLLLEQVIGPAGVEQVLADTGCFDRRACTLTHEVTLWIVLAMAIWTDLPIRQVFKAARRLRPGEPTPHRSSLCVARQRLGVTPLRCLYQRTARPLATPQTPGAFYQAWRLMAIDGTVLSLPDSPANAAAFGYPDGGHRGRGARPQLRKVSLVEVGTHAEIALQIKGIKHAGEPRMARAVLRHLDATMLLLWDRGYFSYALWQSTLATGCQLLARVQQRLVLRPLTYLSDHSYLAKLYPCAAERNRDRHGITVRVIRYRLDDPRRTGHAEEHVLLTTLLDADQHPALTLVCLYHERWEIELVFDEQKTHLDPRRAHKPAQLRSETPRGVLQEVYALALGHYAVRAMMAQAAATVVLDPDRLSFLGCLQILRCRLPECAALTASDVPAWYDVVLWEMTHERTDPVRRNRSNPRVVRQKMSKFNKKRPEHRGLPPLQKAFIETVFVLH